MAGRNTLLGPPAEIAPVLPFWPPGVKDPTRGMADASRHLRFLLSVAKRLAVNLRRLITTGRGPTMQSASG